MFALSPVFLGTFSKIANPLVTWIGDSITAFNSFLGGKASGIVYNRDITGLVTVTNDVGHPYAAGFVGYVVVSSNDTFTGEFTITTILSTSSYTMTYNVPVLSVASFTSTGTESYLGYATSASVGQCQGVNSVFSDGLRFNGVYAESGITTTRCQIHLTKALAKIPKPDIVVIEIGVNNSFTGGTAATFNADMQTMISQCTAAGVKVVQVAIEPQGVSRNTLARTTMTQTANAQSITNAAANSANVTFVDIWTPMKYASANGWFDAVPAYQVDDVHPSPFGASIKFPLIAAGVGVFANAPTNPLPLSGSDTTAWKGQTLTTAFNRGPWVSTTGGTVGAQQAGLVAAGWTVNGFATGGAGVCSVVDRSSTALGFWQQCVYTPGGSGNCNIYPSFDGVTFASLGLAAGDKYYFGVEINLSGMTAGNCAGFNIRVDNGATYVNLAGPAGTLAQSGVDTLNEFIYSSTPLVVPAGGTLGVNISANFTAASASATTIRVGRAFIRKG